MKLPSREIMTAFVLILVSLILTINSPEKVVFSLRKNVGLSAMILFITVIAVGISTAIHFLLSKEMIERYLSRNRLKHLFFAAILGILTPGPIYAVYPIVLSLKKKGIKTHILVSYIAGQAIIGPARIPFEIGLFGMKFFLYRLILSPFIAFLIGLVYLLLSVILSDDQKGDYKTISITKYDEI